MIENQLDTEGGSQFLIKKKTRSTNQVAERVFIISEIGFKNSDNIRYGVLVRIFYIAKQIQNHHLSGSQL